MAPFRWTFGTKVNTSWRALFMVVVALCHLVSANAEKTMLRVSSTHLANLERRMQTNDGGLESCRSNLAAVATNEEVNGDEFLDFARLQSEGKVNVTSFENLPLELIMLFYTAACSSGRDCSESLPTISLSPDGIAYALVQVLCTQVSQFLENLDQSVTVSFQYIIRYKLDRNVEDIFSRADGIAIVPSLESATSAIVNRALNCTETTQQTERGENLDGIYVSSYEGQSMPPRRISLIERAKTYDVRKGLSFHLIVRKDHRTLQQCKYTVDATIGDIIDYDCDPTDDDDSGNVRCGLVVSSVTIQALSTNDMRSNNERLELKQTVIQALATAINTGRFNGELP